MPDPTPILDRDGEWEARVTIRRNGVTVGWIDVLGSAYDHLDHYVGTDMQNRAITYAARYRDQEASDA